MGNILDKYKDYANIDEYIYPKDIPGYITPEKQKVTEDNQTIRFIYKPIEYPILYDLDGGKFLSTNIPKTKFTIKDTYTPPTPVKDSCVFDGWFPNSIDKGTIGAAKFTATWKRSPILTDGKELYKEIVKLCGEDEIANIKAIQFSDTAPSKSVNTINVSETESPIYLWYIKDVKTIMVYSEYDILCSDISFAFKGFSSLRDISFFKKTKPADTVNVESMFEDCKLLSNTSSIEHWNLAKFSSIENTFKGTMALETNTCPSWYKYKVFVEVVSTTGKTVDVYTAYITPSYRLFGKHYNGYIMAEDSILDKNKSVEISGDCSITIKIDPIQYSIRYAYTTGLFTQKKLKYTIEDNDFIPDPILNNTPEFIGWTPSMIKSGSVGDVLFIANYKK